MSPEEFELTAERVKRGENDGLFEALRLASRAYLNQVRVMCRFADLGGSTVMERLVRDALHMALARWERIDVGSSWP